MTDTTDTNAATETPAGSQQPNAATSDNGSQSQETENKGFNIADLPKEAWEEIYKSKRFQQLNDKAKQAEALLKEKADAVQKQLEEQGEWQKLAETARTEVDALKNSAIASEIKAFAAKFGAHDLNDVAALADKAGVEFKDGVVTGAEDAVKALAEAKPHLFNSTNQTQRVGSGTNPGNANNQGVPKFTMSQIKEPAFWQKHETEILAAFRNGTVIDDTK